MNTTHRTKPSHKEIRAALAAVENALFIIGTMRSGTSFLGQELNKTQTLIGCPFELRRIWSSHGVPMASDVCDTICPEMTKSDLVDIDLKNLKMDLARKIIDNANGRLAGQKCRLLNKNPHLSNKVELIKSFLPQAQFIWTYRDITDVVISLKNLFLRPSLNHIKHYWPEKIAGERCRCFAVVSDENLNTVDRSRVFPGGDVTCLAEYWMETCLYLKTHMEREHNGRIQIINHQQLLKFPGQIEKLLSDFLKIPIVELNQISMTASEKSTRDWKQGLTCDESGELERFLLINRSEIAQINEFVQDHVGH